jgi:MFS family permease
MASRSVTGGPLSAVATARVYAAAARNRSLLRVLAAYLCFTAAEYGVWIAVTLYAYARGGPTTAGLVLIAQLIPAAMVAPIASVLGDRLRRDRALQLGYALQALAYLGCGLALWFAPAIVVYGAAVLATSAVTLTRPVHNAILPELAETPEELTAANSLSGAFEGLGVLIGPVTTSALVAVSGPALAVTAFAGTVLAAALLTTRLGMHAGRSSPSDDASPDRVVRAAAEGLRELRADRAAAALTLLGGLQYVLVGMLDVFFPVLAIDVLLRGEETAGLLSASVGVGGLIGAAVTAVLVGRSRLAEPIELALGATGGAVVAIAATGAFGPVVLLLVVAGAGRSFFDVAVRTLLQRSVRDEILARVFGLQEGVSMLGLAIGAAAVPIFISLFGISGAFVAAGLVLPATGLLLFGTLRLLDRRAVLPDLARVALLRAIPLFQPLSQPAFELLVNRLVPLEAAGGDVLIREGDAGDRFYVIESGEAVVTVGGRELARLGPGDHFGEIALLRDVPRTASVTAAGAVRSLALEREDFLAAVTGSRPSAEAAHALVDRRLAEQDRH